MTVNLEQESKEFEEAGKKQLSFNTNRIMDNALDGFDSFCKETYNEGSASMYPKLANYEIKATLGIIQKWINWCIEKKQKVSTIKLKLHFIQAKLNDQGVDFRKEHKKKLKYPKVISEPLHAVTREELQKIIGVAKPKKKAMYLLQSSSAMRIGEIIQLKKSDLDLTKSRIKINIRGITTKTGKTRYTFCSKEAEKYLKPFLDIPDDQLIFNSNMDLHHATISELSIFGRYCDKVGLGKRYPGTHDRMITTHSLRSYAISKLNKVDAFGFGGALAGQQYYLSQYNRFTEEELLELYIKAEPQLWIYHSIPESTELKSLRDRVEQLESIKGTVGESNKILDNMGKEKYEKFRTIFTKALDEALKK